MIQDIIGVAVLSLHHDFSAVKGDEVVIFTLVSVPSCREVKQM